MILAYATFVPCLLRHRKIDLSFGTLLAIAISMPPHPARPALTNRQLYWHASCIAVPVGTAYSCVCNSIGMLLAIAMFMPLQHRYNSMYSIGVSPMQGPCHVQLLPVGTACQLLAFCLYLICSSLSNYLILLGYSSYLQEALYWGEIILQVAWVGFIIFLPLEAILSPILFPLYYQWVTLTPASSLPTPCASLIRNLSQLPISCTIYHVVVYLNRHWPYLMKIGYQFIITVYMLMARFLHMQVLCQTHQVASHQHASNVQVRCKLYANCNSSTFPHTYDLSCLLMRMHLPTGCTLGSISTQPMCNYRSNCLILLGFSTCLLVDLSCLRVASNSLSKYLISLGFLDRSIIDL